MNTNSHLDGPEELAIEPRLLLEFLIKRLSEVLASDSPQVPPILQGLTIAALAVDEESLANVKGLLSSPYLPPREITLRVIEILRLVLDGDDSYISPSILDSGEARKPDGRCCRWIMRSAFREGGIMLDQADYRHVQVFNILAWGGLEIEPEQLAEFEKVRVAFKDDPEEMVREGRRILSDAIFRRTPSGRIDPASN